MQSRRSVILSTLALPMLAQSQPMDLSDAINKAGRQSMLSQRMAKAWFALLLQVDVIQARSTLDRSAALFDRQLAELRADAASAALSQTYQQLDGVWRNYRSVLTGQIPNRANAAKVLDLDGAVLSLANQGEAQLAALSTRASGQLVSVASRQRMLSQRMAKFFLAAVTGVATATSRTELAKARKEFLAAMETLKTAPNTTARIKGEIGLIEGQWVFFSQSLQRLDMATAGSVKAHADVLATSENVLAAAEGVTAMYAALKR